MVYCGSFFCFYEFVRFQSSSFTFSHDLLFTINKQLLAVTSNHRLYSRNRTNKDDEEKEQAKVLCFPQSQSSQVVSDMQINDCSDKVSDII